jgi:hypothetical protein
MVQCHGSPVRLLHAGLCDEPVRAVPEPRSARASHHPRAGAGRPVGQPVPLHRLPAHPGRRAADGRLPPVQVDEPSCYKTGAAQQAYSTRAFEANSATFPRATCPSCWPPAQRTRGPDGGRLHRCGPVGDQDAPAVCQVLDLTRVAELRRVEDYPHHIAIGAAVTLTDAFAALVADRPHLARICPPLCRPAGAQQRARWAAMWPTARRLATPCRC